MRAQVVEYGSSMAGIVSLVPCTSAAAPEALLGGAACWATAFDSVDGDLSSAITVQLERSGPSCDVATVVTAVRAARQTCLCCSGEQKETARAFYETLL